MASETVPEMSDEVVEGLRDCPSWLQRALTHGVHGQTTLTK